MNGTRDIKEALNIAYVDMSRPSHLLCIAIHSDTIEAIIENLESIGYKVIGCTEEIDEKIKSPILV